MSIIDIDPLLIEDAVVTFGTNDHSAAVRSAVFNPNATVQRWRGMSKTSQVKKYTTDWALDLEKAQDWETANSLSLYLRANEGLEVPVTVKPRSGSGPTFSATVLVPPIPIGGVAEQIATSTISLGCTSRPESDEES
jgi:hypothetical protein